MIRYPMFRRALAEINEVMIKILQCDWDIFGKRQKLQCDRRLFSIEELEKDPATSNLSIPEYSQTLCTAIQIALFHLLATWNITPAVVLGYSSGEIAAAYVASNTCRPAC